MADKTTGVDAIRKAFATLGNDAKKADVANWVKQHYPNLGMSDNSFTNTYYGVKRKLKEGEVQPPKRGRPSAVATTPPTTAEEPMEFKDIVKATEMLSGLCVVYGKENIRKILNALP